MNYYLFSSLAFLVGLVDRTYDLLIANIHDYLSYIPPFILSRELADLSIIIPSIPYIPFYFGSRTKGLGN
jgi:hypothetical protein